MRCLPGMRLSSLGSSCCVLSTQWFLVDCLTASNPHFDHILTSRKAYQDALVVSQIFHGFFHGKPFVSIWKPVVVSCQVHISFKKLLPTALRYDPEQLSKLVQFVTQKRMIQMNSFFQPCFLLLNEKCFLIGFFCNNRLLVPKIYIHRMIVTRFVGHPWPFEEQIHGLFIFRCSAKNQAVKFRTAWIFLDVVWTTDCMLSMGNL